MAIVVAAGALAAVGAACGGDAGGAQSREVLVDYVHDEFAASYLAYFPRDVTLRPGDTVNFRQEWTGEPHSVTMGTMVDEMMGVISPLIEKYGHLPDDEIPPEVFEEFMAASAALPYMLPDTLEGGPVNQNVGQPCYLDEGAPPEDPMEPCTDEQQEQPAFDGRQSYYNSGFIPYAGERGNTFDVVLANDIEPGTYAYYCNVHGPFQAGTITVVGADEEIPSEADVARQALAEIEEVTAPLAAALEEARASDAATIFGQEVRKPYAGWGSDEPTTTHAVIDEFIPKENTVTVGESITWSFVGGHTVSFNVPDYFTQLSIEDDGTVIFSPDALQPRGGPGHPAAEGPPPGEGEAEGEGAPGGEGEGEGGGPPGGPPPEPVAVDAGTWDGRSFLSSGMFFDGTYSVTFTEPGRYSYACLVHPAMVGSVVVEEA
ncbi:MAG: hypothetical protein KY461_00365 [Actinobacteria bacterium]|nr:hypothetical protein [Actinomycetota bacterium]